MGNEAYFEAYEADGRPLPRVMYAIGVRHHVEMTPAKPKVAQQQPTGDAHIDEAM